MGATQCLITVDGQRHVSVPSLSQHCEALMVSGVSSTMLRSQHGCGEVFTSVQSARKKALPHYHHWQDVHARETTQQ